jgi:hypothetical protein
MTIGQEVTWQPSPCKRATQWVRDSRAQLGQPPRPAQARPGAPAYLRSLHHPGICCSVAPRMRKRPTSCRVRGEGWPAQVSAPRGHRPRLAATASHRALGLEGRGLRGLDQKCGPRPPVPAAPVRTTSLCGTMSMNRSSTCPMSARAGRLRKRRPNHALLRRALSSARRSPLAPASSTSSGHEGASTNTPTWGWGPRGKGRGAQRRPRHCCPHRPGCANRAPLGSPPSIPAPADASAPGRRVCSRRSQTGRAAAARGAAGSRTAARAPLGCPS